ncbi:MAG: aminotransferase class I/II-fold pyridoxal phosphate-dependent enzyme [archaeon]|nr:aminotransferase class I/II-fold pyridoxal phosphate-dependent enzyme [archaeon]
MNKPEKLFETKIAENVILGNNVKIVNPSNLYGCQIGNDCFIGPFVEIQKGAKIGNNTKIESHSFVCELVTIGNNCFIGHGVMFINDTFSELGRPAYVEKEYWKSTSIGNNVTIGSNATILPVKICDNVVIGAGAVVTKNIDKSGVYAGVPAKFLKPLPKKAEKTNELNKKIEFVDLKRQLFGDLVLGTKGIKEEIDSAVSEIVKNTNFIMGSPLEEFEKKFAEFCGAKYCIGLNSGTDALEFALRCNKITSGNVITVPNSYFTTTSSITQAGAIPKFVDIDKKTYNINIEQLEKAIDKDTKAIVVVHLYGRPAKMDAILNIARKYNLKVIEDCAHAPGAKFRGQRVPIGRTGCFSFFPGKNIGAWGDGGALVTDEPEVARLARLWRNDGSEKKYYHEIIGRKARLDSLQAGILSIKLNHLDKWNDLRRKHARKYNELLSGIKEIQQLPLLESEEAEPIFHIYNILVDKRDELLDYLNKEGICAGIHYPIPIHLQPAYMYLNLKEGSFPVAEEVAKKTLSLPMFPELREEEIMRTCESIKEFFREKN